MKQMIVGILAAYSLPLAMLILAPGALRASDDPDRPWLVLGCRICGWVGMVVVTLALAIYAVIS